jgi:hypothetical protein
VRFGFRASRQASLVFRHEQTHIAPHTEALSHFCMPFRNVRCWLPSLPAMTPNAKTTVCLAFVATRSDLMAFVSRNVLTAVLYAAFGVVSVSSIAPPLCSAGLGRSYVIAEALEVMNSGEWTRRLFCFCILLFIGINWVLKSYTVRNRMQKLISLI